MSEVKINGNHSAVSYKEYKEDREKDIKEKNKQEKKRDRQITVLFFVIILTIDMDSSIISKILSMLF